MYYVTLITTAGIMHEVFYSLDQVQKAAKLANVLAIRCVLKSGRKPRKKVAEL